MSSIVTDQLRILNANNFTSGINSSSNSYYLFVGLTNSSDYSDSWNINPPSPKDNFDEENSYWESMVALRRINPDDIRNVVKKINWSSGTTYDMYEHNISRENFSSFSNSTNLYTSNFYVVNSEFRVYICLYNGISPENPLGRPSLDEPNFTDLEPKPAGSSGDGYIWKYLYTINPNDINKFITSEYIPLPKNWGESGESLSIKNNAETGGQLKIITVTNRGVNLGLPNTQYLNVPINGDGSDATATITVGSDSKINSITISNGGSGYTYGSVDLNAGNVPLGDVTPTFNVIIPPKGGHGFNVYREMGSYKIMIYSRLENDLDNPDFIIGNSIARIGIVENPQQYSSNSLLSASKVSALNALKLIGPPGNLDLYKNTSFVPNSKVTQTIGTGTTSVGRVVSYDPITGILKYWQDRALVGFNTDGSRNLTPEYGFKLNNFTSNPTVTGNLIISGGTSNLYIDTNFGTENNPGISTQINNRTYNLGQSFVEGVSNPEVKRHSGNIIYIDNRPSITRSQNQREDIKVILQF